MDHLSASSYIRVTNFQKNTVLSGHPVDVSLKILELAIRWREDQKDYVNDFAALCILSITKFGELQQLK